MVTEENSCDMRFSRNHGNSSGKSIPFDVKEREKSHETALVLLQEPGKQL